MVEGNRHQWLKLFPCAQTVPGQLPVNGTPTFTEADVPGPLFDEAAALAVMTTITATASAALNAYFPACPLVIGGRGYPKVI